MMKSALLWFLIAFCSMACATNMGRLQAANVWGNLTWGISETRVRQAYPACKCDGDEAGAPVCGLDTAYLAGEAVAVRFKFSGPPQGEGSRDFRLSEIRFTPKGHSAGLGGRLASEFQERYGKPRAVNAEIDGRVTMIWMARAIGTRIVVNATKGGDSTMRVDSVVYTRTGKTADEKKDTASDD